MKRLFYDIETRARSAEELAPLMPRFEAPGNYKDPDKIAANIAEQRRKWITDGALSPLRGQVLAIGYLRDDDEGVKISAVGEPGYLEESDVLREWRDYAIGARMGASYKMIGWHSNEFDVPFIVRRMWANGLDVPLGLVPSGATRFFLPQWLVDLRDVWGVGDTHAEGTLAQVGALLGCGTYETSGAQFAELWDNPETRSQAVAHLTTQLRICAAIADRFGVPA